MDDMQSLIDEEVVRIDPRFDAIILKFSKLDSFSIPWDPVFRLQNGLANPAVTH